MAELQFRSLYGEWLERQGLTHSPIARERFATAHAGLCGRDPAAFNRGYAQYLLRHTVEDSVAAFARYCAPRWRNYRHLYGRQPSIVTMRPTESAVP